MMQGKNSTPASAIVMGILFCIVFIAMLYFDFVYQGPTHIGFVMMLIVSMIFLAGGVILISVAVYFVRRRGFRWSDHFIPQVIPRKTGVTQPSYDVERPNQGLTKICPACEHKIASDSKACPNCGELFVDLPPE